MCYTVHAYIQYIHVPLIFDFKLLAFFFLLFQNAFPTQGLYSTHLLSLDALLAIVHNFSLDQSPRPSHVTPSLPLQQQPFTEDEEEEEEEGESVERSDSFIHPTQFNSAGIIFTSGAGLKKKQKYPGKRKVAALDSLRVVHSHSSLTALVSKELPQKPEHNSTVSDVIKAASGYQRGQKSGTGDMQGDKAKTVALPTPKELIEIRQKKKVIS